MNAEVAVDEPGVNERAHCHVRFSVPRDRVSDVLRRKTIQIPILRVVVGPPPKKMKVTDRSGDGDVERSRKAFRFGMSRKFLMALDPRHGFPSLC